MPETNVTTVGTGVGNLRSGHSEVQHGALLLCGLLAAISQLSVLLIGQKMQLSGWYNGNECVMRYVWTHKLQLSAHTVHFLYCGVGSAVNSL